MGRNKVYQGDARERHRLAMQKFREEEKAERAIYLEGHPIAVYVTNGKATGTTDLKNQPAPEAPKNLLSKDMCHCGSCVKREDCKSSLYFRLNRAEECKNYKPRKVVIK